jgi:hypothetical protein
VKAPKRWRSECVERRHGRIWFGERGDRWSVNDYDRPELSGRRRRMTQEGDFLPRDVISDFLYLLYDCPTTKLAQQKLAAIRAALRNVPSPYPEEP